MKNESFEAVRAVRREADRLRLTCIGLAPVASIMHLAFDNTIQQVAPTDQIELLGDLDNVENRKVAIKK